MGKKVTLACCALNQWALDFEDNLRRILKSELIFTRSNLSLVLFVLPISGEYVAITLSNTK